jgi:hypothetical protein
MNGVVPVKIFTDLSRPESFKSELYRIGGVYGFINVKDSNKIIQYIGFSKDLYQHF